MCRIENLKPMAPCLRQINHVCKISAHLQGSLMFRTYFMSLSNAKHLSLNYLLLSLRYRPRVCFLRYSLHWDVVSLRGRHTQQGTFIFQFALRLNGCFCNMKVFHLYASYQLSFVSLKRMTVISNVQLTFGFQKICHLVANFCWSKT